MITATNLARPSIDSFGGYTYLQLQVAPTEEAARAGNTVSICADTGCSNQLVDEEWARSLLDLKIEDRKGAVDGIGGSMKPKQRATFFVLRPRHRPQRRSRYRQVHCPGVALQRPQATSPTGSAQQNLITESYGSSWIRRTGRSARHSLAEDSTATLASHHHPHGKAISTFIFSLTTPRECDSSTSARRCPAYKPA